VPRRSNGIRRKKVIKNRKIISLEQRTSEGGRNEMNFGYRAQRARLQKFSAADLR
jgi:hypothetical protein